MKVFVKVAGKKEALRAIEAGADGLVVSKDHKGGLSSLGRVEVLESPKEVWVKEGFEKDIREEPFILRSNDWRIVPWENLVARGLKFIVPVSNREELDTAKGTLEKGVYGVLIEFKDLELIRYAKEELESIKLLPAAVTKIEHAGLGDRVCVDTSLLMKPGEGMLVGNTSSGYFLVHSETVENPYASTRPFRVNAGGVHAYVKTPEGTKYLVELSSGSKVTVVNTEGTARVAVVGRVKIEKRPLILVEAECSEGKASLLLQNAETVHLTGEDGRPISVTKLKKGDKVLCFFEEPGRHFGIKVKESIVER